MMQPGILCLDGSSTYVNKTAACLPARHPHIATLHHTETSAGRLRCNGVECCGPLGWHEKYIVHCNKSLLVIINATLACPVPSLHIGTILEYLNLY
ncbi:hypothetical protein GDO78_010281 [Eleutherodactylus coqui]|uniref:Uncharacterized protein n=1 Tax=Eleutherodactylus coqui TaxID=57060 RepID=A0A8J6F3E7_ELECQ|nr:hypothetical protein GDO78_010281 [Eleutherodactylus coqui]